MQVGAWQWPWMLRNWTAGAYSGSLLGRGGCQHRGQSLANCDHGDSTTGRFDSPVALAGSGSPVRDRSGRMSATVQVPFMVWVQWPSTPRLQPNTPSAHLGTSYSVGVAMPAQQRPIIGSRWVSKPRAVAGTLQPRRLNDWPC
jgi:hypothetical protein